MRFFYLMALIGCAACSAAMANPQSFEAWRADFKKEAVAQGIPASVVARAIGDMQPLKQVIKLDRKQPEGTLSFSRYKQNILTKDRIAKGRALYRKHYKVLQRVTDSTGVPPQFIIALWGIETNYGGFTGNTNTLHALATLAYDGRRADFFRKELIAALRILADGNIAEHVMQGSWAGAMGQCQFMPSSYHQYAVDGDGDGVKDIWHSLPDVFASIGHYLQSEGWSSDVIWGREVKLPAGMALDRETLYQAKPLSVFKNRGVTLPSGAALPDANINGYLMHPGEPDEGAYLVYQNYHVLLHWNRSRYFATAVGLLADAIAAGGTE